MPGQGSLMAPVGQILIFSIGLLQPFNSSLSYAESIMHAVAPLSGQNSKPFSQSLFLLMYFAVFLLNCCQWSSCYRTLQTDKLNTALFGAVNYRNKSWLQIKLYRSLVSRVRSHSLMRLSRIKLLLKPAHPKSPP